MNSTGSPDEPALPAEAVPEGSRLDTIAVLPPGRLTGLERRRMALALFVSLLIHLPLLTLTFGGDGQGLPGFAMPWQARRVEAPDLRVLLLPARVTSAETDGAVVAEPLPPRSMELPVARPVPPAALAPSRVREAATVMLEPEPKTEPEVVAVPVESPSRADSRPAKTIASIPEPAVIAQVQPDVPTFVVPAPPAIAEAPMVESTAATTTSTQDAEVAARAQAEQEARERSVELARLERERLEASRRAEQLEAARQETARLEAARREAAREEASRREAARQESVRQETARQDAARQEAARQEAARKESARQEAANQEVARQEATRQAAARQEAARLREIQEAEAKREERLRALGRQLDAEAAKREAASRLPYSVSSARRGRLFGRTDPNAELVLYAEAFVRKIQMNMTFDMVREAAKQPHTNPMVTVAVRSDGSVESVAFVVSSGVQALDEAIRRVVQSQEHYPAFSPVLAREYDVVEIRRTWHIDMAIRLY